MSSTHTILNESFADCDPRGQLGTPYSRTFCRLIGDLFMSLWWRSTSHHLSPCWSASLYLEHANIPKKAKLAPLTRQRSGRTSTRNHRSSHSRLPSLSHCRHHQHSSRPPHHTLCIFRASHLSRIHPSTHSCPHRRPSPSLASIFSSLNIPRRLRYPFRFVSMFRTSHAASSNWPHWGRRGGEQVAACLGRWRRASVHLAPSRRSCKVQGWRSSGQLYDQSVTGEGCCCLASVHISTHSAFAFAFDFCILHRVAYCRAEHLFLADLRAFGCSRASFPPRPSASFRFTPLHL